MTEETEVQDNFLRMTQSAGDRAAGTAQAPRLRGSWWEFQFQSGFLLGSQSPAGPPSPLGDEEEVTAVVPRPPYHLPSPGTVALQADVWTWAPSMGRRPLPPQAPRLFGERNPALTLQLWRAAGGELQGLRQLLFVSNHTHL